MRYALDARHREAENSGSFRVRQGADQVPDIQELGQRVRVFADPQLAAVLIHAAPYAAPRSVVVAPQRVDVSHTAELSAWLSTVSATQVVEVPTVLRRVLCCFKAWVCPIATPGDAFGVMALPVLARSDSVQRSLASLACDFALRLDAYERCRVLERLRVEELVGGQTQLTSLPANGLKYA
jgi:hypothetical protein